MNRPNWNLILTVWLIVMTFCVISLKREQVRLNDRLTKQNQAIATMFDDLVRNMPPADLGEDFIFEEQE